MLPAVSNICKFSNKFHSLPNTALGPCCLPV